MTRKDIVFAVLGAFFITNAVVAELIGGKLICLGPEDFTVSFFGLFQLGPFVMSLGVIPWPVVFVTTDLINEYFGRRGVRRLTWLAVAMIIYAFLILTATMPIPAWSGSPVDSESFQRVFGQSRWIIVGSIAAFVLAQIVDVTIFHAVRRRTGSSLLWLRTTGSTVISQLIDSLVVLYIGLAYPLEWSTQQFVSSAATNYSVKLLIALAMTPVIYAGHAAVEKFLGRSVAEELAAEAAATSERRS